LAPIAKPGFVCLISSVLSSHVSGSLLTTSFLQWAFAGVSRTLNVTYIKPIPAGEEVLVEGEVIHAGKRLCSIKGVMRRKTDGAVLAICEHGKVSIDPEVGTKL